MLVNTLKKEYIDREEDIKYQIEYQGLDPKEAENQKLIVRSNEGPHFQGISNLRKVEIDIHDLNVHEVVENVHKENDDVNLADVEHSLKDILHRIEDQPVERGHKR